MPNLDLLEPEPEPEPRWPGVVAILAVAGLNFVLPPGLRPVPPWVVMTLVVVLAAPAMLYHRSGNFRLARALGYTALGIVTITMVVSLTLLVAGLMTHKETPPQLLLSASLLWVSNILVFASWYWRLDAGGPHERDLQRGHKDGAFLFPQMVLDPELRKEMGEENWRPGFVDYLFLAFNTSTAFSPTDVPVLSRWAKVPMMLQAAISLATLALLAARAVNIL
jgi:hypothetical protein